MFTSHLPERFMFAPHVPEHFGFAEIVWKLAVRLFLGMGPIAVSSCMKRRLVRVQEITRACSCFRFRFGSVAYRTPPRALVRFVMHTLSKELLKHLLNC